MNNIIKKISIELFVDFITPFSDEILQYFDEKILNEPDENIPYYGLINGGELIGVFSLIQYSDELELTNCFIHPNERNKGHFTFIIEYCKEIAKLLDMDITASAYLSTSQPIFKKLGFIEIRLPIQDMIFKINS